MAVLLALRGVDPGRETPGSSRSLELVQRIGAHNPGCPRYGGLFFGIGKARGKSPTFGTGSGKAGLSEGECQPRPPSFRPVHSETETVALDLFRVYGAWITQPRTRRMKLSATQRAASADRHRKPL
ncbi:hypothetical protein [Microbispora bryophytorum]|uniref:hypothetical protein n=1 Tax=Microbispora bryophytorum TaxID=1460882 RepID=UPI0033C21FBB